MRINKSLFVGSVIYCALIGTSVHSIINSAIAKETKENISFQYVSFSDDEIVESRRLEKQL